jgi:hypothetical protein
MENSAGEKKRTAGTSNVGWALWDPFWFMREMFGWGRFAGAPSFDVKETDDSYNCKVNVKLMLPPQADVKAELDGGELTLVVPKAAAIMPPRAREPMQDRKSPGGDRRGSAGRTGRRGARKPARRR